MSHLLNPSTLYLRPVHRMSFLRVGAKKENEKIQLLSKKTDEVSCVELVAAD